MRCKPKLWQGFLAMGFASSAILTLAQDQYDSKLSAEAEKTAKTLSQQIRKEISQLKNHEWAGEYYEGDGLGENVSLTIAPKHGYVFEWHGCLGLYDRNYGHVTATNERLQLSFTFTNKQEGFGGIANEFITVRWGERIYLVPPRDIVGFCNEVNSGFEPRNNPHGRYLLRRGDEKRKAKGDPAVPPEFQTCLLKQPIKASITQILKTSTRPSRADFQFKDTTVTISSGKKHGLRPGMELYVTDPDRLVITVTVLNVLENTSEGIITQIVKYDPAPKVGWTLSTSPPWRAAFSH